MGFGGRRHHAGDPRPRLTPPPPWVIFLSVGIVLAASYYVLPESVQAVTFLLAPAASMTLALRARRRASGVARVVWLALAAALTLATVSDIIYLSYPLTTGHRPPFPSLMDVVWLASYPCYLLAVWAMARQQRDADQVGNLLDAAIIAINGGILLWVFLLNPIIDDTQVPAMARLFRVLYPAMDLLVFATIVGAVVSARMSGVTRLLMIALATLLLADLGYVVALRNGTFDNWGPLDAAWILSALLVGAAALHPAPGDFVLAGRAKERGLTPRRTGFLCLALLVGPAVLTGKPDDMPFLAALSSVCFVLVTTRMWLLSHSLATARAAVVETSDLLRHRSLHDALTGLPNRALLLDRIRDAQARARRSSGDCTLLLLGLDGFKAVNDAFGRDAGDRLLVAVADRLRTGLSDVDSIGRLGGDEYVVVTGDEDTVRGPEVMAERILDLLRAPFDLGAAAPSTVISASIGIAVDAHARPVELLRGADVALDEAKAAGRNCYQRFRPEMEAVIQRRYELDRDLRNALAREEFFVVYQPIFRVAQLRIAGFEALLRWNHPVRGLIGATEFIPLLESSGLIVDVGRWALRTACRQAAAWRATGCDVSMSVNVSARQLDRDSIVEHVADALLETGLAPAALTVEITETALMNNVAETARRLQELKALGVRIAVDDFGTGYSSLAYLQQFPVDCLKIDQAFTSAIGTSPESGSIIHTFVQLAKGLGLESLAEGVETAAQMRHLRREGVDSVQGFLLAKPLLSGAAEQLLFTPAAHRATRVARAVEALPRAAKRPAVWPPGADERLQEAPAAAEG